MFLIIVAVDNRSDYYWDIFTFTLYNLKALTNEVIQMQVSDSWSH